MVAGRKAAVCAATAGLLAALTCAGAMTWGQSGAAQASVEEPNAVEQLAQEYPLEYGSYMAGASSNLSDHDHTRIVTIMEAPLIRDGGGYFVSAEYDGDGEQTVAGSTYGEEGYYLVEGVAYDADTNRFYITDGPSVSELTTVKCLFCKSNVFTDLYEQYGEDVYTIDFTDEVAQTVDGRYWDCACCHEGDPAASDPAPQQMFFNNLVKDSVDDIDNEALVCGQCHNYFGYRRAITSTASFDEYDPYRNGFDADDLYQTKVEDGLAKPNEETGLIETGMLSHADLEMWSTSTHRSLGVTCVDCHMAQTTSEDGTTYTDHNASGSPLEKAPALQTCLTCHEGMGVEDADAMVEMVREVQETAAAREVELSERLAALKVAYLDARDEGKISQDVLDQVADDYGHAYWYVGMCSDGETVPGVKAAMFNDVTCDLLDRAEACIDEAEGLLG